MPRMIWSPQEKVLWSKLLALVGRVEALEHYVGKDEHDASNKDLHAEAENILRGPAPAADGDGDGQADDTGQSLPH